MEKREDRDLEPRRRGDRPDRRDSDDFFGLDVEKMSPKAQAVTGVVTGGLILLAAALLIAFTNLWWLIFIFGWAVFPAFGVFARGVAGLIDTRSEPQAANARERELLEALHRSGELTPAQAAMETSLTVNEADEMLKDLAAKGHLDVRVRGGGLFYGLWEPDSGAAKRRLGDE
ncbi:MAG: hypothetical protein M3317_01085 [Actinomycetota bacterium]|nr:hypothetical protein [Actinomycetota bacterium]